MNLLLGVSIALEVVVYQIVDGGSDELRQVWLVRQVVVVAVEVALVVPDSLLIISNGAVVSYLFRRKRESREKEG